MGQFYLTINSISDNISKESIVHNSKETKRNQVLNNKKISSELKPKKKPITEFMYYSKMSISQRKILKKAVNANDKISQCDMGDYYSEEGSSHIDYSEAKKMYSLSANQGYDRALLGLGRIYDQHSQDINDKKKAFDIYMKLAEQGLSTAQFILGMKYRFGDGVEENIEKAIIWISKSAEQGNIQAICNLGDIYQSVHDSERALKWFRIGASKGSEYCKRRING